MGGQQFRTRETLVDCTGMNRVLAFDRERGLIRVEAGIMWPALIDWLHREQAADPRPWGIRQKQTGVDEVTVAGTIAANGHGRGLTFPPFVSEVESLVVVDADGRLRELSRSRDSELFALVCGGYGLFGIVVEATLRLVPRTRVQREVDVIAVRDVPGRFAARLAEGFLYGDCQYATHLDMPAAEHPGVFACYRPIADGTPVTDSPKQLSSDDWAKLYRLARTDKPHAFSIYTEHYRTTHGQVYWSDAHQLAGTFAGHRDAVDAAHGTEMITEIYVRPESFVDLLSSIRADFVERGTDMTYGTIRRIERDNETFLPWASESCLCIVCNLHVRHTVEGIRRAQEEFRGIIDRTLAHGGRFFLTYHRWATPAQVQAAYPRFREFLRLKRHHDPACIFTSDWWAHWSAALAS
jgi:FAD/FMN-containing dehydrogenase